MPGWRDAREETDWWRSIRISVAEGIGSPVLLGKVEKWVIPEKQWGRESPASYRRCIPAKAAGRFVYPGDIVTWLCEALFCTDWATVCTGVPSKGLRAPRWQHLPAESAFIHSFIHSSMICKYWVILVCQPCAKCSGGTTTWHGLFSRNLQSISGSTVMRTEDSAQPLGKGNLGRGVRVGAEGLFTSAPALKKNGFKN